MSLPQLHPGFPGKSFWLEDVFGATEMTATRLAAWGRSLHTKGSTDPATNTVKCLKGDVFARFCGPTADPCYHHLDASHWPPCPHPAGASAVGASQAVAGFCRQSALKLLGLLKQPRGLRREAGAGRAQHFWSPGSAIWRSRRARGCFGACQICFLTWLLPFSRPGMWARSLGLLTYKTPRSQPHWRRC